ncbi:MAG: hypothetical protein PPP58_02025 [Natronomonas sp.]
MDAHTVIETWDTRPFDGLDSLRRSGFDGVVESGSDWIFFRDGDAEAVVSDLETDPTPGTVDTIESGTAYRAPHPTAVTLAAMLALGGEVRGRYFTDDTPLSTVDETLSSGGFTGYVELTENVLSGDYYAVYRDGVASHIAYIGPSNQLFTDDEAESRAKDEVGIYSVVAVSLPDVSLPVPETEPDDTTTGGGAVTATGVDDEPTSTDTEGPSSDSAFDTGVPFDAGETTTGTEMDRSTAGTETTETETDRSVDREAVASASDDAMDEGFDEESFAETRVDDGSFGGAHAGDESSGEVHVGDESSGEAHAGDTGGSTDPAPTDDRGGSPQEADSADGGSATPTHATDAEATDQDSKPHTADSAAATPEEAPTEVGETSVESSTQDAESVEATEPTGETDAFGSTDAPASGEQETDAEGQHAGGAETDTEAVATLREELDALQEELDSTRAELRSVRAERDKLRAQLREADTEVDAGVSLSSAEAFAGTKLFVQVKQKGGATMSDAHAGAVSREALLSNLTIERHTQFEDGATVEGEPFETFLVSSTRYQFVTWLLEDLLFEIDSTGSTQRVRELYDALPEIHRIGFDEPVTTAGGDGEEVTETVFDVVCRTRMGDPLVVANLDTSRDPTRGDWMEPLVTDATSVADRHDTLAAAFAVTGSFFESDAMAVATEATSGSLLSRDSRESYVKLSRKQGFHLCLVEFREEFHLTLPDL